MEPQEMIVELAQHVQRLLALVHTLAERDLHIEQRLDRLEQRVRALEERAQKKGD